MISCTVFVSRDLIMDRGRLLPQTEGGFSVTLLCSDARERQGWSGCATAVLSSPSGSERAQ